ncbi:DUF4296 domain-containing protein [Marinilabilia rubra]|uniref:DUF4296 domain-containing protein n=1 Tax=Marinilabilia rubra TaxID=2162893 RepID=A0A2U2B4K2_9BACT|nr:DUF4296 domain-containing protein [Marinilabilia rubra]PWD97983.1 DUF4296 domain-containing protein [Marinilabilia rubra]
MLSFFSKYISRLLLLGTGVMIFVLQGCDPQESVPKEYPDKEEMASILADLYWTESVISNNNRGPLSEDMGEDRIPGYYRTVLDKYDLTAEGFDSIRQWYASHPYHYQDVYQQTIEILSKREADFNKRLKEQKAKEDTTNILKDLWVKERTLRVTPGDTANLRLPFEVSVDSLVSGNVRLTSFYKFLRADMTRNAHVEMISMYSDSTMDTISYDLEKAFKNKSFSISQPIDTADTVIQISGFLFDHDSTERAAIEFSKIKLEHFELKEDSVISIDHKDLPKLKKIEIR